MIFFLGGEGDEETTPAKGNHKVFNTDTIKTVNFAKEVFLKNLLQYENNRN